MQSDNKHAYGIGDATFTALGGTPGIRQLVDYFYDTMESNADFQTIWSWHHSDKVIMRDKLSLFLCAWTGGPKEYGAKYGGISIPAVHAHLSVGIAERDQWLNCMQFALEAMNYPEDLKNYMLQQLAIPAERVRVTSKNN